MLFPVFYKYNPGSDLRQKYAPELLIPSPVRSDVLPVLRRPRFHPDSDKALESALQILFQVRKMPL